MKKSLTWVPRILAIGVGLFLMLFSFDVFAPGHSVGEMALGFLMHNLPSIFIGLMVWVSWRRPWIGAVVTIALGFAYIILTRGNQHITAYLLISGPLLLTGILYALDWRNRRGSKEIKSNSYSQTSTPQ